MIVMDILSVLILGGVMLYVVRPDMVTRWFSSHTRYSRILSKLTSTVTKLEALAQKEEKKAEAYIAAHMSAADVAEKARATATNIGKLFA